MNKRIAWLLVFSMLIISLTSCSLIDAVMFRQDMMEKHGDIYDLIDWYKDETGEYLIYQERYYKRTTDALYVDCFQGSVQEDDVLISWSDGLYFYEYYADRAENPTYIYTPKDGGVYVRRDYEYTEDTFTVEGTEIEFVMSEALIPTSVAVYPIYYDAIEIAICSRQCPKLYILLTLVCKEGIWYAVGEDETTSFVLSEAFVVLLDQQGVVPTDGNK